MSDRPARPTRARPRTALRIVRGSLSPRPRGRDQRMDLVLTRTRSGLRLTLRGDLDIARSAELTQLLRQLENSRSTLSIDLGSVPFADCGGLGPFIDSAQRRVRTGLPPLVFTALSPAVARVMNVVG